MTGHDIIALAIIVALIGASYLIVRNWKTISGAAKAEEQKIRGKKK
jgi:hypothetical protein